MIDATATIGSTLSSDPDMVELVELFLSEIPQRLGAMAEAFEQENWNELRRVAHQWKGAGGSYGYPQLSAFAARVEDACVTACPRDEIRQRLDALVDLCGRLTV
ncbi:MAG: hypothetical protein C0483_16065 [Pirellula sp.]|nr:hypothetical protein [Pirellula sp.]